ncbi:MAG: TlpA family protein disulfide reductase [Acidobacteriia bacterium]|nr:TlpA family protein disulfide reductase [Terriglobia bacterium]
MSITAHSAKSGLLLLLGLLLSGLAAAQSPAPPDTAPSSAPSSAADSAAAAGPVIRFVRNPDSAPPFALKDLAGKPLALAALRGKVVLLNFWATWCKPCRAEIPDLIDLQTKYAGKLQIVGLSVDDDAPGDVQKFVQEFGINYPVALAPPGLRELYGGIPALPTSFVLDTEGRVVQKHTGLRDPALYETEIRALLGLPFGAKIETFEDTGQVFLQHADRATELPGVDLSKLTPEQKQTALRRFNAESCSCPCQLTLAQCRINDSACPVSQAAARKIVAALVARTHHAAKLAPPAVPEDKKP